MSSFRQGLPLVFPGGVVHGSGTAGGDIKMSQSLARVLLLHIKLNQTSCSCIHHIKLSWTDLSKSLLEEVVIKRLGISWFSGLQAKKKIKKSFASNSTRAFDFPVSPPDGNSAQ